MDKLVLRDQGPGFDQVPTCSECGGWGLGYASIEHHHECQVAAGITEWKPILANDKHWDWLIQQQQD